MADESRLVSRRERHKDERRMRIIRAAHDLMREVGVDDLSVKMIADRADVSAATVYNLFGAKAAVLSKVYEQDYEAFAAKLAAAASPSALDAIFDAVKISAEIYRSDPSFYRGMSIRNPRAEPELVVAVQEPRRQFWQTLLERAIGQRDLNSNIRSDLISQAMLLLGGGAFGSWCADLITLEELELQTCYGLARLLLGVARPAARARLQARIAAIEATSPSSARPAVAAP